MQEMVSDHATLRSRSTRRAHRRGRLGSLIASSEPLALVLGLALLLLGLAAWATGDVTLARPLEHLSVLGLHATPLMAVLTIVFALVVLLAAAAPGGDRFGLLFAGALALSFGLIVLVMPDPLHRALGVHVENGLVAAVCGLLLLESSLDTPRPWRRRR